MKIILVLLGVGAGVFGAMHAVRLVGAVGNAEGPFAASVLGAHVAGVAIGAVVAIVCFSKCRGAKAPGGPDQL